MHFLVCISKTPDTTARIAFTNQDKAFQGDGVQFIMNPYDEWYALVRALELAETGSGKVTLINVGTATEDPIIRKGLAIGGDEAVRIDAEPISADFVARQIAAYAKDKSFDIIFCGKETIDYNGALVGSMVAELLDLDYVSNANHLVLEDGKAIVRRDVEGGEEELEVPLPLVISAAKGLAEQRIPNMRGIMMAKTKPLHVLPAVPADRNVEVNRFEMPPQKGSVKMIPADQPEELIRLLHEEAKMI